MDDSDQKPRRQSDTADAQSESLPESTEGRRPNPLREIVQPFVDLIHAPRALWGVNISNLIEGMVYFGILTYLAMYFNKCVGLTDVQAGPNVGVLAWGITLAMFFLGGMTDKWGVRRAILLAVVLMGIGRVLLSVNPYLLGPAGLWSSAHLLALGGILFIVLGYGMYQPAIYAAVRQFTTEKTAGMGFAMLYALMNLGGWLPTFLGPVRRRFGIPGAYVGLTGATVVGLAVVWFVLSKATVDRTIAEMKSTREKDKATAEPTKTQAANRASSFDLDQGPARHSLLNRLGAWLRTHPLADRKFSFFIFCLIPVQTLFAHNWLTLPLYAERAYRGTWVGANFEAAVNFNPLLVFVLVPIVAAVTQKVRVYSMMILGTFVMAMSSFLLTLGTNFWLLLAYVIVLTVGEAMWQPRFLQYAAEIAPEGKTGVYMGVASFPWFLTKMITSAYSGWFLARYCPDKGPTHPETMWLIYGCIAISSSLMLILARGWLGKDFKTKAS